MEVFGKFETNGNDVYRTEAYIDLDPCYTNGQYQPPILNRLLAKLKNLQWSSHPKSLTLQDFQYQFNEFCKKSNYKISKEIIGTIFMFNPGGSRPKNIPNFPINVYLELKKDNTMNTIIELLCNSCYKSGLIEIKNLFNLRKGSLQNQDFQNFAQEIVSGIASYNIEFFPKFNGQFVFFAWGESLLANLKTELLKLKPPFRNAYWQSIINSAYKQNKTICYITNKNLRKAAEDEGAFYHPGWIRNEVQKAAMKKALCKKMTIQYVPYIEIF